MPEIIKWKPNLLMIPILISIQAVLTKQAMDMNMTMPEIL